MDVAKGKKLVHAIRNRPPEHDTKIEKYRVDSALILKRTDWLWHLLLSSMSTMGNNRGYKGLMETRENYTLASYSNLLSLDPETRLQNIRSALEKGGVRMFNSKARWLDNNFSFIQDCGGMNVMQHILLNTKGRSSKIKLMRLFEGIGNKYARNIFMDMCHEDFIDSIAVDERLSDILDCLNVDPKSTYLHKEEVLVQIAHDCEITPWHLDRLLYSFKDYYLKKMNNI